MNEFLRNFVMTGIRDMIAKNVALYQTYQYASGWFSKNVLTQEDLQEIERLYEEKAQRELEEIQKQEENSEEVQATEEVENVENVEVAESEE